MTEFFTNSDISHYYDLSESHYNTFWNLKKSHSLHYGYWDKTTRNFHEALLNINKVLSDIAGIKSNEKILDAGCGVGGSSIWLAKEKDCHVTGISLNATQIARANLLAWESRVSHMVLFEQKDYNHTGYNDCCFDVVWGIESICYTLDKGQFLREAYRILKNGGRLIIADFFKTNGLGEKDEREIKRWAAGWAINDFSTIEMFSWQLENTGFRKIEVYNATDGIWPSARRLYRYYFIGIFLAKLYHLFYGKVTKLGKNNVSTARFQYETLKKGLWNYKIIKAIK